MVTDDQDMAELAREFEVKTMSTLELTELMLDSGFVDLQTIQGLIEYWRFIGDRPANMDSDFNRLFGSRVGVLPA